MLWGFVAGEDGLKFGNAPKGLKWAIGIVILIAVVIAVLWAAGINTSGLLHKIFYSSWSSTFWTNVIFVVIVAAALAFGLSGGKK